MKNESALSSVNGREIEKCTDVSVRTENTSYFHLQGNVSIGNKIKLGIRRGKFWCKEVYDCSEIKEFILCL